MLHKFLITIIVSILFVSNIFAHDQITHQHLTREAFKLLKKSFPNQLTDMENYIGTSEVWGGNSADGSFGALKIVSGSYLEDEYDVVYGYGLTQQPNYNQTMPVNTLISMFGSLRKAHTSITHFWNADNGENTSTFLNDNSDYGYWSFTISENAMKKMRKYTNGIYDFVWAYNNEKMSWTWCGGNSLQLMTKFNIPGIINFYKSIENFQANSYMGEDAYWHPTNCPSWGPEYIDFHKAHSYEILGRMCHLLEDMSVPAHVHCDAHAGKNGMYEDYYEVNAPNYHQWTADEIFSLGETYINPYNSWDDPVLYLMYLLNQTTDHYASGRTNGDDIFDASCPGLSQINSTLGLPTNKNQINHTNILNMHDKLFPLAIRATAGLLYWFAVETGQLPHPNPPSPLSISISGPTSLGYNEQGTFTANPSGGSGSYTNYRWWERNDGGLLMSTSTNGGITPLAPPTGYWIEQYGWEGQTSVQVARAYSFSLKCEVTDSDNNTATDIHSVTVLGGFLAKAQSEADEVSMVAIPEKVELTANYPNPFNPNTTIRFGLPDADKVLLQVFNVNGQLIATLVDSYLEPGYHDINFNGQHLSSGIYLYKLSTADFIAVKRMLIVK